MSLELVKHDKTTKANNHSSRNGETNFIEDNRSAAIQRQTIAANTGVIQKVDGEDESVSDVTSEALSDGSDLVILQSLGSQLKTQLELKIDTTKNYARRFLSESTALNLQLDGAAVSEATAVGMQAIQQYGTALHTSSSIANGLQSANNLGALTEENAPLATQELQNILDADETLSQLLRDMIDQAFQIAHLAVKGGLPESASIIMGLCNEIEIDASKKDAASAINAVLSKVKAKKSETAQYAYDVGDTSNNIFGVGGGIGGIIEAAGVSGASGGAVVGMLGGILGIVFGSISTIFAIVGLIKGFIQRDELAKIAPSITDEHLAEITEYAKNQTETAMGRAGLTIGAGLTAVTAGALGIAALSVATLGTAAIITGIAAATIGLGFVAFKYIHSRTKRKGERRAFAKQMVDDLKPENPDFAKNAGIILGLGLNPEDKHRSFESYEKLIDKLADKIGDMVKSKRQEYAEGILDALVNGKPSQQFEAELVVKALGREPKKARERIAAKKTDTEVARLMGQLSSW